MIRLLEELVNIPSISGNESHAGDLLVRLFQDGGYVTKTQPVADESFNVYASISGRARVWLCSHMDTVAPFLPFQQKGDLVYGRGVCDAKGQIVAMFQALERLRAERIDDVGMLVVVCEETTSIGAKKAAQLNIGSEYVVLGEPTGNKLAIGQKGVFAFQVKAFGTGGHSSLPDLGESAIHKLLNLLNDWIHKDWGEDAVLGKSVVNVGLFHGGVGMNVLAPEATAEGIFRVATSLADIREKITATLPADIELESKSESEPQLLTHVPGFATTVVGFGSDAAHLRPLGEILLYGAGSITAAHRENEHVAIKDLQRAVDDYIRIVKYLLKK